MLSVPRLLPAPCAMMRAAIRHYFTIERASAARATARALVTARHIDAATLPPDAATIAE